RGTRGRLSVARSAKPDNQRPSPRVVGVGELEALPAHFHVRQLEWSGVSSATRRRFAACDGPRDGCASHHESTCGGLVMSRLGMEKNRSRATLTKEIQKKMPFHVTDCGLVNEIRTRIYSVECWDLLVHGSPAWVWQGRSCARKRGPDP